MPNNSGNNYTSGPLSGNGVGARGLMTNTRRANLNRRTNTYNTGPLSGNGVGARALINRNRNRRATRKVNIRPPFLTRLFNKVVGKLRGNNTSNY